MLLELFNHDLNKLGWIEYEKLNEINHIWHIYSNQFWDLVSWFTAVTQINERRTEFVFP